MGCCGERRRLIREAAWSGPLPPRRRLLRPPLGPAAPLPRENAVYFEYTGPTGMTAYGAVTGRRYRFSAHGSVAAVHRSDAESLAAVAKLRRLT